MNILKYLGNLKNIGKNYSILANLYYKISDYGKALSFAFLCLKNIEETDKNIELGRTYLVIALILSNIEDLDDSEESILIKISELTKFSKDPVDYFETSVKTSSEVNNIHNLVPAMYEYGKYLYLNNEKEKGLEKIRTAKENAVKNNLLDDIENIKDIFTELNINN